MKTFYKARLYPSESGLLVTFSKFYMIRETPCFYMCVSEMDKWRISTKSLPLTNKNIKRIHKTRGRFAFETKELAIEHLRMLKRKQIVHMNREIAFNECFLACENLPGEDGYGVNVPNSKALVSEFVAFD